MTVASFFYVAKLQLGADRRPGIIGEGGEGDHTMCMTLLGFIVIVESGQDT